jgi:hypothetical protein
MLPLRSINIFYDPLSLSLEIYPSPVGMKCPDYRSDLIRNNDEYPFSPFSPSRILHRRPLHEILGESDRSYSL